MTLIIVLRTWQGTLMTKQTDDSMVAFEQSRVAELAEFYRALAALSESASVDELFAQSDAVWARIREMSPVIISTTEELAFSKLLLAMKNSCCKALG